MCIVQVLEGKLTGIVINVGNNTMVVKFNLTDPLAMQQHDDRVKPPQDPNDPFGMKDPNLEDEAPANVEFNLAEPLGMGLNEEAEVERIAAGGQAEPTSVLIRSALDSPISRL